VFEVIGHHLLGVGLKAPERVLKRLRASYGLVDQGADLAHVLAQFTDEPMNISDTHRPVTCASPGDQKCAEMTSSQATILPTGDTAEMDDISRLASHSVTAALMGSH
jgi:hypothetical protein